jgi:hypothetical protein
VNSGQDLREVSRFRSWSISWPARTTGGPAGLCAGEVLHDGGQVGRFGGGAGDMAADVGGDLIQAAGGKLPG